MSIVMINLKGLDIMFVLIFKI